MLKHIDSVISPDLIKTLMEMGHGDELVLADGNFPAQSHTDRCIRADGHSISQLLKAILKLFPLDSYVESPVALMMHGPEITKPAIWDQYDQILQSENQLVSVEHLERFAFYERAKKAYAIVATSEKQLYANIILKKGVISEE